MALPTSYTETTFKDYLHALLNQGGFATDLGWSVAGGQYNEIVNDALTYYGSEAITSITGVGEIRKIRIAGRVALWEGVVGATAHYADLSTPDNARASLSQIYKQAALQLERAKGDAAAAGLSGLSLYPPVTVGTMRYKDDPYQYYSTEEYEA